MKTSHKKALLLISIIALFSLANFFFPSIYNGGKQIILLGVVLLLLHFLLGINFGRKANDKVVLRNILIYVLIYYLLIYLLGLYTGFIKTVYGYNFGNVFYNILPSLLTIIGTELIRGELIRKTDKSKLINVLVCIAFIIFDISISFASFNFGYKDDIYQFIGLVALVSVTRNILMNIIHTKTDYIPAIVYRIVMETITFLLMLQPDLGPYLSSVGLIILPALIGIMILNMDKTTKAAPKNAKKNSKLYLVISIVLVVLVLLNSGLLKYHTLVIGSNSMYPLIKKGDVILIEHLYNEEIKTVQIGEILVYKYDGKIICHRVTKKLDRENEIYYKTKGDNNSQEDAILISKEKVVGKVLFRIRYIGLPSVWLSELFN